MLPTALFLTADLIFTSRVCGVAAAADRRVEVVSTLEAAVRRAAEVDVRLLILDLTLPGCRPEHVLRQWNQLPSAAPVVAYGPHVAEGPLESARQAGCAEVLTRGQFDRSIGAVLDRYLSGASSA